MNKNISEVFTLITIPALMLMALPMQSAMAIGGGSGSISLNSLGSAYPKDFDTFASTAGTMNSLNVKETLHGALSTARPFQARRGVQSLMPWSNTP